MKISEMKKMFLESRRRGTDGARKRCKDTTIEIYERNLGILEDFLLQGVQAGPVVDYENIRRGIILELIDWIGSREKKKEWSRSTALQFWRCLRSFFKWIEKDEDCQEEGLRSMGRYLPAIESAPRREYIPMQNELRKFRNSFDTHKAYAYRNYVMFSLLLDTGIRVGELCNLKLEDLLLPEGLVIVDGKTGRRAVPVTDGTTKLLRAWLKARLGTTMGQTSPYVFISKYQHQLTENGVGQMLRKMRKQHNLPPITAHTLRHSFASYSLRNGAKLETVRTVLGHTSLITTSQYLHMAKIAGKEMKEELEKASVLNNL